MTNPRRLASPLTVYRIGDVWGKHPVYSADGASLDNKGRWHVRGARVIYAAEHFSTAMLEKLAHWSGSLDLKSQCGGTNGYCDSPATCRAPDGFSGRRPGSIFHSCQPQ